MLQRDESIKQLQEDLLESQTQYSACYNEVTIGLRVPGQVGVVMTPDLGLSCGRIQSRFIQ